VNKGSVVPTVGGRQGCPQPLGPEERWLQLGPKDSPIVPTKVPQGIIRHAPIQAPKHHPRASHKPLRRRGPTPVTLLKAVTSGSLPPLSLVKEAIGQLNTDPYKTRLQQADRALGRPLLDWTVKSLPAIGQLTSALTSVGMLNAKAPHLDGPQVSGGSAMRHLNCQQHTK
jgi:hypothetical protein